MIIPLLACLFRNTGRKKTKAALYASGVLVLVLAVPVSSRADSLLLSDARASVSLNGQMDILRDSPGTLTIEDVQKPETGKLFKPLPQRLNAGYTDDVYWLRFTLQRESDATHDEWWLEIYPPVLDELTFYKPAGTDGTGNPVFREMRSGDSLPARTREVKTNNFVFAVVLTDTKPHTYYLRVKTSSTMLVDAVLWNPGAFIETSQRSSVIFGVFYGVLGLLIIINFAYWIILRDKLFLIYPLFLVVIAGSQLSMNGYTALYLFPESPYWTDMTVKLSVCFWPVVGILLFETLIPSGERSWRRRYFRAVIGFSMLCALISLFGWYGKIAAPLQIVGLSVAFIVIFVSVRGIFRNVPSAGLYTVTFIIYYICTILTVMRNINALPVQHHFIDWSLQIGNTVHMLLIQLAIAIRFSRVEQERKAVQKRAQQMEQEIARTQKLESLAGLAGGIAHDFNNMLTVIMSTTTLAKMYAGDNFKAIAKLQEAEREIIQARGLTNQLLTFAKGGAPVKKLAAFAELLRETTDFSIKGSTIGLKLLVADDLWPAEIDRVQISQVISNLVLNARQAMPGGGTLTIQASNITLAADSDIPLPAGNYLKISFTDTGEGIAPELAGKIFDPFFTTKPEGSGLGLSTTFSIIKRHNGHISVRSVPGTGSTFTVYLPASAGAAAAPARQQPAAVAGSGRVLIRHLNTAALTPFICQSLPVGMVVAIYCNS